MFVIGVGYRHGGSRYLVPSIPQSIQVIVGICISSANVIACRPPGGFGYVAVVKGFYHTIDIVLYSTVIIDTKSKQIHRVRADAQVVHIVDVGEPTADVILIVDVL